MRGLYLCLLSLAVAAGCTSVYVISGEGNSMERSHEGDVEILKRRAVIVKDADKPEPNPNQEKP